MQKILTMNNIFIIGLISLCCSTVSPITKNEIESVDNLKEELKAEIISDAKQGKPVDYRKREIVDKLNNYVITLKENEKQAKELKEEKELADSYRTIRKIAVILLLIGLGFLAWRYKDVIISVINKIPGVPKI